MNAKKTLLAGADPITIRDGIPAPTISKVALFSGEFGSIILATLTG
jgi:hypothetical protein